MGFRYRLIVYFVTIALCVKHKNSCKLQMFKSIQIQQFGKIKKVKSSVKVSKIKLNQVKSSVAF